MLLALLIIFAVRAKKRRQEASGGHQRDYGRGGFAVNAFEPGLTDAMLLETIKNAAGRGTPSMALTLGGNGGGGSIGGSSSGGGGSSGGGSGATNSMQ